MKLTRGKNSDIDVRNTSESINDNNDDDNADDDDDDDDDGSEQDDLDEYEEELRDIAESHEAMSRDDKDNSTDGINHSEIIFSSGFTSVGTKNFDSHEKSVEESSDESITSNEAISSEKTGHDTEVDELLKFTRDEELKSKRVPTVKKELSSQKEIHSNNTQFNVTMEMLNNDVVQDETQVEQRSLREKSDVKYENADLDTTSTQILEKLDKRQQSKMKKDFDPYPPSTVHTTDLNKPRKLWSNEYTPSESLVELLMKLAENPRHWNWTLRLLKDLAEGFELNHALDSNKRDYRTRIDMNRDMNDIPNHPLLMKDPESTSKKPKKKKKKKKKPRNQQHTTSTMTPIPLTSVTPIIESTEVTTPGHWRSMNDLFASLLPSQSNNRASSNIAKVHYATSSNQRDDNSVYINDETSTITDSNRQYPLPRKFHFGKINTHEKGSPLNQHDPIHLSNYESDMPDASNSRLFGYDPPDQTTYQRSSDSVDRYNRYGEFVGERTRNFDDEYLKDYQEPVAYPANDFSRRRDYYDNPWKYAKYESNRMANPYFNNDRGKWATRYGSWKSFWPSMVDMENEGNDESRMYGKFRSWSPEKNMRFPSSWRSVGEVPRGKSFSRDASIDDKNRNRSELNDALKSTQKENDNANVPKITLKTWNSLTSDPATWPFKLSDAKPWPKDKNGKSYNPNADLVRKLGLDKQNHDNKDEKIYHSDINESSTKIDDLNKENIPGNWNKNVKTWPSKISPKIKSVGAWVVPTDQSTWKSYKSKQRQSFEKSDKSRWPDRTMDSSTWQGKLTDWNAGFGKQSSHAATWPSKWKQFSYHKVNTAPISKPGTQLEGSQKTRNGFIAVSAVSPSKYLGNEWRKNDIEEIPVNRNPNNSDRHEILQINQWTEHTKMNSGKNDTDPLENQLEELRQNYFNKRNPSTTATYLLPAAINISTTTATSMNYENKLEKKGTQEYIKLQN